MIRKNCLPPLFLLILFVCCVLAGGVFAEDADYVPLREWFDFEDPEGLVQEIDLPPVTHHGIEIELREILIDYDHVYLSLMMKSDRIQDALSLQLGYLEGALRIGEEKFDLYQYWGNQSINPEEYTDDGSTQVVLGGQLSEEILSDERVSMTLRIEGINIPVENEMMGARVLGPWGFKFTADGKKASNFTRKIALGRIFTGNNEAYFAKELIISPVRSQLCFQRLLPSGLLEAASSSDVDIDLSPIGNLQGFALADQRGNRIELSQSLAYKDDKDVRFYSNAANNGWTWLQDASELTITPYMTTIAGIAGGETGLNKYQALAPIHVASGSDRTELEKFMADFEPAYELWGQLASKNPYVKPVRMMRTTASGAVIMLDRALVTEDEIAVSVLMATRPEDKNRTMPEGFMLGRVWIEVEPILPYPENYFEVQYGSGGGGGGPYINIVHEDPLVVYDGRSSRLMFQDGYVSPKDPMHVKVTIQDYSIDWADNPEDINSRLSSFTEEGPWIFEFDTDGAELAAKTKEFELKEVLEIEEYQVELNRLRFNPMHLILFTGDNTLGSEPYQSLLSAFIETDDGTQLRLSRHFIPYTGFDRKIIDEAVIQSLEKTKRLKVLFCLNRISGDYPQDYDPDKIEFYTCDPAWSTVIDLN